MTTNEFIYVTYIKSTPEKLWKALTTSEFTRQYWNVEMITDWKKGSKWKSCYIDDKREIVMGGEVIESTPPKRLVFTWQSDKPEFKGPPPSRVTYKIEQIGDMVRLQILHDKLTPGSVMDERIRQGWPRVVASLKSLLETGVPLDVMKMKQCAAA